MILNHFEVWEEETWKQTQGIIQSVLHCTVVYSVLQCVCCRLCSHAMLHCVFQVVYSCSAAVCVAGCRLVQCFRLCTHAVLQCVLQSVQQVDVVVWKQVLDDLSAENTSLIHVNHFPHLQPAGRMLRRRHTHHQIHQVLPHFSITSSSREILQQVCLQLQFSMLA